MVGNGVMDFSLEGAPADQFERDLCFSCFSSFLSFCFWLKDKNADILLSGES